MQWPVKNTRNIIITMGVQPQQQPQETLQPQQQQVAIAQPQPQQPVVQQQPQQPTKIAAIT
jgi:hypothetical protein